jgi:hypothetical protein
MAASRPLPVRVLACLVASMALAATPGRAQQNCAAAIVELRSVIETESQMGHVAASAKRRLQGELARIEDTCRAGRDAEALRALAALRSRYGYR